MTAFTLSVLRWSLTGFLFFANIALSRAQVIGCKDPAANNYNAAATVSDSSCIYNQTFYTPPLKVNPMNALLAETSGLQWAGNSLWTFNDGGGAAAIYRIDTSSNAILQTVNLGGATNVDWEDIAFDGTFFYVGDFGNNATGIRTDLKIYKFPLSAIADYANNPTVTIPSSQIAVINFTYSDQTDFSKDTVNYTKFDCEAMIVDGGKIHLFSKNWIDTVTTHYLINDTAAGTYVAAPLETLPTGYLVTGGDKVPGLNIIVLLGYQNGIPGNHYLHLLSDFSGGYYFNGNRRKINLPDATVMGQGEGITFLTSSYGFISNESLTYGPFTITQKLRSFNTEGFVPAYVLPLDLTKFTVQAQSGKHIISWNFAAPVAGLQLLHSENSSNFNVIKNVGASASGSFVYEPFSTANCYRLMWQQTVGGSKYSNIVCVDEKVKQGVSNVVLRKTGELSFTINRPETNDYLFKLMSVDGKLLAQTTQRLTASGFTTVRFAGNIGGSDVVLLQIIGRESQYSQLVKVGE